MSSGTSPISSRKMVPPFASSNRPRRRCIAPVNAPFSWPKSSEDISAGASAAQFTLTKAHCDRRDFPPACVTGVIGYNCDHYEFNYLPIRPTTTPSRQSQGKDYGLGKGTESGAGFNKQTSCYRSGTQKIQNERLGQSQDRCRRKSAVGQSQGRGQEIAVSFPLYVSRSLICFGSLYLVVAQPGPACRSSAKLSHRHSDCGVFLHRLLSLHPATNPPAAPAGCAPR